MRTKRRMLRGWAQALGTVWALSMLIGCGGGGGEPSGTVTRQLEPFVALEGKLDIAGGTAHLPIMEEAQKRIMSVNPTIKITVAGGGSGQGVKQVSAGLVHIGNTGRALSEEEIQAADLKTFPFAIDGVAVIVNPGNTVKELTAQQAKDRLAARGVLIGGFRPNTARAVTHLDVSRDQAARAADIIRREFA